MHNLTAPGAHSSRDFRLLWHPSVSEISFPKPITSKNIAVYFVLLYFPLVLEHPQRHGVLQYVQVSTLYLYKELYNCTVGVGWFLQKNRQRGSSKNLLSHPKITKIMIIMTFNKSKKVTMYCPVLLKKNRTDNLDI